VFARQPCDRIPEHPGFRPVALRPTLSGGLPLSGCEFLGFLSCRLIGPECAQARVFRSLFSRTTPRISKVSASGILNQKLLEMLNSSGEHMITHDTLAGWSTLAVIPLTVGQRGVEADARVPATRS